MYFPSRLLAEEEGSAMGVEWGRIKGGCAVCTRGVFFSASRSSLLHAIFWGWGRKICVLNFFYFSALDEVDNFFKKLTLDNILGFKKVMNCYSGILVYHGFTQTPLSVLFLIVPQMTPYPNPLTPNPQSEVGKEEIFRKSFQPWKFLGKWATEVVRKYNSYFWKSLPGCPERGTMQ